MNKFYNNKKEKENKKREREKQNVRTEYS